MYVVCYWEDHILIDVFSPNYVLLRPGSRLYILVNMYIFCMCVQFALLSFTLGLDAITLPRPRPHCIYLTGAIAQPLKNLCPGISQARLASLRFPFPLRNFKNIVANYKLIYK